MSTENQLDQTFSALSHPVRRAMLARLVQGEATVKQLAEPFEMSLPAISKHVKVLERAGLISQGQDAQFRPCKLNPEPLKQVASWVEIYRQVWEGRFNQMETFLQHLAEGKDDD